MCPICVTRKLLTSLINKLAVKGPMVVPYNEHELERQHKLDNILENKKTRLSLQQWERFQHS